MGQDPGERVEATTEDIEILTSPFTPNKESISTTSSKRKATEVISEVKWDTSASDVESLIPNYLKEKKILPKQMIMCRFYGHRLPCPFEKR